jgi:hypothetical protein
VIDLTVFRCDASHHKVDVEGRSYVYIALTLVVKSFDLGIRTTVPNADARRVELLRHIEVSMTLRVRATARHEFATSVGCEHLIEVKVRLFFRVPLIALDRVEQVRFHHVIDGQTLDNEWVDRVGSNASDVS